MVQPPVSPRPNDLPFNDPGLSWEDFERFCVEFVELLDNVESAHRYGTQGDTQLGIDIVAEMNDGTRRGFQCKKYQKYTAGDAREAINKATYSADNYVLLLSCEATASVRDVIAGEANWELWDRGDISRRVRNLTEPDARRLVATYFGDAWENAFLGAVGDREIKGTNLSPSPFVPLSGRIDNPQQFFNREKEIREVFDFLNGGSSVALIGESGIGKSSILKEIERRASRELQPPRQPVYLSLANMENQDDLYDALCDRFEILPTKGYRFLVVLRQQIGALAIIKSSGFGRKVAVILSG